MFLFYILHKKGFFRRSFLPYKFQDDKLRDANADSKFQVRKDIVTVLLRYETR
jgi:hypothetical protein